MNIKIKAVDIELTEAIRNYSEKKIEEVMKKFINKDNIGSVLVEFEISKTNKHHLNGDMYKASIQIKGFHKNIFIEEVRDDLYVAIDGLKDKLGEMLSNTKTKKRSITHKLAIRFKNIFKKGNNLYEK